MIYQTSLQRIIGISLVITLIGCAAPATPIPTQTQAVIKSLTATPAEAVIISPTSIQITISNFEECVELGNAIQSTFPRQCTNTTGEIFKEALPEGIIFGKVYSAEGYMERAYSIISTLDGGYLIAGQANIYQCLIRKLDPIGETQWEYALGLELREEFQFTNGLFRCWSAIQVSDGSYVVIGSGYQEFGVKRNFFLLRLDRDGNRTLAEEFLWKSGMSLQLNQGGKLVWRSLFGLDGKLIETSDNGYAVVGRPSGSASDKSTHIIKADEDGNYAWERNLCRDKNISEAWEIEIVCSDNSLADVIQSKDGGYVMTGGLSNRTWLIKTDSNGNIEWIQAYLQEMWNAGHALIQLPDGGYLIAGAQLLDTQYQDGKLIRADSLGNMQWSRTFGGDGHDMFNRMLMNSRGEIIVIGSTASFGEGAENIWLLGIDLSGLE